MSHETTGVVMQQHVQPVGCYALKGKVLGTVRYSFLTQFARWGTERASYAGYTLQTPLVPFLRVEEPQ